MSIDATMPETKAKASTRIQDKFSALKAENRKALVTFITAGDPDAETSAALMEQLPGAGADIIELGMPFSDPMADGPAIQASSQRALKAGQTLRKTLDMVRSFRAKDDVTPIVLMGYYNPIYIYGVEAFVEDALNAGVDGLIVVDLPPEEDEELCLPALKGGLHFIRLATPTTDAHRLPAVLANTSGFVYYVSIAGITGTATANAQAVGAKISSIHEHTDLPIVVGFGIKTPQQAHEMAQQADGVVVGSAIVSTIADHLDEKGVVTEGTIPSALKLVQSLAQALR